MKQKAKTLIPLLAVYLIWGSTYLVILYAIEEIPALMMAGTRFVAASLPLLIVLKLRGAAWPTVKQWRNATLIGALMLAGGIGGVTFAEQWISSSLAAIVVATVPMWVAVWIGVMGKWPNSAEWLGLTLGLFGVIILNFGGQLTANPLGAIVLLCAPISWALGSALSRRLDVPDGVMGYAIEMLAGGGLLLILSTLRGEAIPTQLSSTAIWAWVYLVTFGSLIGFSAYMYLLRNVPTTLATSYAYVNPIVAVVLGVLIADEAFSIWAFVAMTLIIISVITLSFAPKLEKYFVLRRRNYVG